MALEANHGTRYLFTTVPIAGVYGCSSFPLCMVRCFIGIDPSPKGNMLGTKDFKTLDADGFRTTSLGNWNTSRKGVLCFWLKMGYPIWSIWFIMTFPIQMPYYGGFPFSDILKFSTIAYTPDISWSIASVVYIPFNSSCSNPPHQQSDYNSQLSFVSKWFTLLISVQSTVFFQLVSRFRSFTNSFSNCLSN